MVETIELIVNATKRKVTVDPAKSLLLVLRDDLDLTGCKYGCGEGQCGACSVLIGGKSTRSCITPVGSVAGKSITTIEGLAKKDALHPVQDAFIEADAMQCGYCIPGMIISAVALLTQNPHPSDAQISRAMQGNICRCGTYPRIVNAIRIASMKPKGAAK